MCTHLITVSLANLSVAFIYCNESVQDSLFRQSIRTDIDVKESSVSSTNLGRGP